MICTVKLVEENSKKMYRFGSGKWFWHSTVPDIPVAAGTRRSNIVQPCRKECNKYDPTAVQLSSVFLSGPSY
jgi:hypothetical protein